MKKIVILGFVAALFVTSSFSTALALEPAGGNAVITEGPHGHRPPPPPPPRHDRGRKSYKKNDWVGFGIGAALGAVIGATASKRPLPPPPPPPQTVIVQPQPTVVVPQPQPTVVVPQSQQLVYDPSCNCYYYR